MGFLQHVLLLPIFCILLQNGQTANSPHEDNSLEWSYSNQEDWPENDCKGNLQSPIEIKDEDVTNKKFPPFQFDPKFSSGQKATISNEDKTINLNLAEESTKITISGGGLSTEYQFLLLDFHWSSEHKINGKNHDLEIQLSFYATKYASIDEAVGHSDGFVNIAVFFDIATAQQQPNKVFDNIVKSVGAIASTSYQPVTLDDSITLSDFLPKDTTKYYLYKGSITKPFCEEIVTFIVYPEASYITEDQLNELKKIQDTDGSPIESNRRDLQDLNGRPVYFNEE